MFTVLTSDKTYFAKHLLLVVVFCVSSFAKADGPSCGQIFVSEAVQELEMKLADAGNFRWVKNGVRLEIDGTRITPGKSYVVVISWSSDKLYIGEDYRGPDGTTKRTHPMLWDHVRKWRGPEEYVGGAIRVNANGSVDISGYFDLEPNAFVASKIANLIREVSPETEFRITGDRLSTLENLATGN